MSLVAYGGSSDEYSDDEEEVSPQPNSEINKKPSTPLSNGHTEDERIEEANLLNTNLGKRNLTLPTPKVSAEISDDDEDEINLEIHSKLPTPKTIPKNEVIEEDDEFLHKKELPPQIEKPPPPPATKKLPVKITIPSLEQFRDYNLELKKDLKNKPKDNSIPLLSMLPEPKNEFVISTKVSNIKKPSATVTSLVPDHIRNKMKNIGKLRTPLENNKTEKSKNSLVNISDSEDSDDEAGDFFSLNKEVKLPEVSKSEIQAMVAKKAQQMAQASKKIEQMIKKPIEEPVETPVSHEYEQPKVDQKAFEALVGVSNAKKKKVVEQAEFVELSSEQILPDRNEWMRATLTAETSYQPRGLVDEEPAPGTRKKHQITYLAHQAKANEAELQAMWASNRQNRRATANKYGF